MKNQALQPDICARGTMFFSGACVASGGVLLTILQERYGFDYEWGGTLLAALSVGNLVSAFLTGILPAYLGDRHTVLLLSAGYMLGFCLMAVSGNPLWLLAAFFLAGIGKGSTLNASNVLAGKAPDRTRSLNLIHAAYAVGALLSPLFIAALSRISWNASMFGFAVCGLLLWLLFSRAGLTAARRISGQADGDWSFLRSTRFWILTALIFFQNCTEISVTGWMVTYFKDTGILPPFWSQGTITVIWLATLIGRLAVAFVLPIRSRPRALAVMSVCCLISYMGLMNAHHSIAALVLLALFGLSIAGINPTAVACVGSAMSARAMGILLPTAGIGAIVMPYITGAVGARLGISAGMMAITAAVAGMLVSSLLLVQLERRAHRKDT